MAKLSLFERRRRRVRTALKSRAGGKPRLSVHRTGKHIYAQIIDDAAGKTVAAASTLGAKSSGANVDAAVFELAFTLGDDARGSVVAPAESLAPGFDAVGHLGDAYGLRSVFAMDRARGNGVVVLAGGTGTDPAATPGRETALARYEERIVAALHRRAILGLTD